MTASQTVFLTQDRTRAVPVGHTDAKFKLVHAGQEIAQAQLEKYEGAVELAGGVKKAAEPARERIETRQPHVETRDPKHKHR